MLSIAATVLGLMAGCGNAEPDVDPHALVESQEAYARRLDATPDSVLAASSPLDSLFLDHDLSVFGPVTYDSAAASHWVDSVMATLSLDEKIGQLFIVHLPMPGLKDLIDDRALKAVTTYGVGGFLIPRLMEPRQVYRATRRLQRASRVPLFMAADYERGVGRYNNALTELPSNMALGATRDTSLSSAAGRLTALESRAVGVNLLLAPVVDVNNNPENPIINIRSYGEDPVLVGQMARAFVGEAQRYGVLTTLKHFPGHGNTSVDSHSHMGMVQGDAAALDSIELRPYRMVLDGAKVPAGVMSAHLWVPAYDAEPLPATFSRHALHAVLRDSLGFDGFIVTDDIRMGALQHRFDDDERLLRPLQAGADVILTPADLPAAVEMVKRAVRDGRLDEDVIDDKVERILRAKTRAALHRRAYAPRTVLDYLLEKPRGAYIAQRIADRAVTVLRADSTLPLAPSDETLLVQLSNTETSESIPAAMDFFAEQIGAEQDVQLGLRPTRRQVRRVLERAQEADVVVLALYLRLQAGRGEAGLFDVQESLVRRLMQQGVPVVLVTFGNPYAVSTFPDAEVLVVAYEQALESVMAVARILQGRQRPQGQLPIAVQPFPFGAGLQRIE